MRLPLYLPDRPLAAGGLMLAVEHERARDLDPACARCSLSVGPRTVCMPADGEAGGVLLVGEKPGKDEDAVGRVMVGSSGSYLRQQVARFWKGPVALDNAVRCAPGERPVTDKMVDACRGYLAGTYREAAPARVVCVGSVGAAAVLGRSVPPLSVRRGYAWTSTGVPVFLLMHAAAAARNRLLRAAFEADLGWALTVPVADLLPSGGDETYAVVSDAAEAASAAAELRAAGKFGFDFEWVGRPYGRDGFELTNLAACAAGQAPGCEHVWVWDAAGLRDARREPLRRLMRDPSVLKVGSNLPVDVHASERGLGAPVRGQHSDVRLKRKLLEADADGDLAVMAELVGLGGHKEEADAAVPEIADRVRKEMAAREKERAAGQLRMIPRGRVAPHVPPAVEEAALRLAAVPDTEARAWALGLLPPDVAARYNARDALATIRLDDWCDACLAADHDVRRIWELVVQPAVRAVQRVEAWGVCVDADAVRLVRAHLSAELAAVDARLAAYVPPDFNWDSTQQVADFLFKTLKLPISKLTPGKKPAVDDEVLDDLRGRHPAVDDLAEHRRLTKLRGTYADGMLRAIGADGRVHGYILLDGAGTGRSSMMDPNFQNIPRADKPEGKLIRQCVVAAPGCVLVELDYGTLEPRVAAVLSGDPVLKQVFADGRDFHQETAIIVKPFLWPRAPTITKDMRQEAKPIGLASLYGKAAYAMAITLGCSKGVAQQVLDAVVAKYRGLARWIQDSLASARRDGCMRTWWAGRPARRRPLWNVASHEDGARGNAERASYNGPIQGTASDFLIKSLSDVVRLVDEEALPAKVVLPVHDSLLLEVPVDDVPEVVGAARAVMLSHDSAGVPLVVDVKVGPNWGAMVDYEKWRAARNPPAAAQGR